MPWWWGIITFVFGSGGAFTIIWFAFTRRINKTDKRKSAERAKAVAEAEKRAATNKQEWLLAKAYREKMSSVIFLMRTELEGMMKEVGHNSINGNLAAKWKCFKDAEKALEKFENEQAASLYKDRGGHTC